MLEFLFEKCNINVTRCVIEKEQSSVFHLGTLAVSSRGCEEGDMEYIGQLFDKGCGILKGYKG